MPYKSSRRGADRIRQELMLGSLPQQYWQKVLSYNPIAYWTLRETSGTVAECLVNPAQNGTYARDVSVMGTGAGIGDGYTAPLFDGTNDCVRITSAALTAAFNGNTGGMCAWAKVSGAGVWTDGADRAVLRLTGLAGLNEATIPKYSVNNQFRWRTKRNNVFVGTVSAESSVAWELWSMSWDVNGFYLYRSGTSRGAPALAQPWSAAMDDAYIGSISNVPVWPWSGQIYSVAVFNYTVSQAIWQDLATV